MSHEESPGDLSTGLVDLHSHLLPGIDDGCQDLAQTLLCIASLKRAGFVGSVCTPHVVAGLYPRNVPVNIRRQVEWLSGELAGRGVSYQLWDGGEVRISRNAVAWLTEQGVPTLGPGRCVLIDWWGSDWPPFCDDVCQFLLDERYQPVLAHPERMGLEESRLLSLLDDLQARGVWLQGNLNSFSGGEGPEARELGRILLRTGRYAALASDTHGPESVPGRRSGLRLVLDEFGETIIREMLDQGPRRILNWGLVEDGLSRGSRGP